ncbi:uncharacterized protein [Nicotiana tomentosiformis]|uniref:uncharacterized protein n=1 Tax=Nicotiana tomentosiformis TaxID=4098 RepID=UPI00388CC353
MASIWYETMLLGRPAGATPLTWDELTMLFMNHFLPDSLMQKYARDFERLVQTPDMDVSTYNTKFCKLARYALYLVPTEDARLTLLEKLKTRDVMSVQLVIYVRRPRHERLSVAVLVKIERQEIRDNNNRINVTTPVCQTCGRSHLDQYRVLMGECFRCGQLGHHLRDCPQPPRNFNQASIQSAAPTQTTRNTSGATCTRNRGRGAGDRAAMNQGQGNAGRGQTRVFAFTRQDAQASNVVVTGILFVCSCDALALIDPGSTHSYVSSYFALRFSRQPELLNDPFLVATPVGESLLAEYVYRACQIRVEGRDTLADLIVLNILTLTC